MKINEFVEKVNDKNFDIMNELPTYCRKATYRQGNYL